MQRFELVEGTASKFWEITIEDAGFTVCYGRIGTSGRTQTKTFSSVEEAQRAATKLTKQKTAKGYVAVDGAATPAPGAKKPAAKNAAKKKPAAKNAAKKKPAAKNAAKKKPPAPAAAVAAADLPKPAFIDEAGLTSLATKLAKKSKRSPRELIEAVVGDDRWEGEHRAELTLVALLERRQIRDKLLPQIWEDLRFVMSGMTPPLLLYLVEQLADVVESDGILKGYPDFIDDCLLHAALQAPDLVTEDSVPAATRRALPLVRRRLGLGDEGPVSTTLARELAHCYLTGPSWFLVKRGERLERERFSSHADSRAWAASVGVEDGWDELVVAEAGECKFNAPWKGELLFLQDPIAFLRQSEPPDDATVLAWLAARGDTPAALSDLLDQLKAEEIDIPDAMAVYTGAQLASAGAPIPDWIEAEYWLQHQSDAYLAALKAWPRERVLRKVTELLDDDDHQARDLAAVGLGAHFDETLLRRFVEVDSGVSSNAGCLGMPAVPLLVEQIEQLEEQTGFGEDMVAQMAWKRRMGAVQAVLHRESMRTGDPLAPQYDRFFEPRVVVDGWRRRDLIRNLPQERRDAYVLAWAELDPFETFLELQGCSDGALRQVIARMFEMRAADGVYVSYPKGIDHGNAHEILEPVRERALPMIRDAFVAAPDADAVELLECMPWTAAERDDLLTSAGSAAPAAAELSQEVLATLDTLVHTLDAEESVASIKAPTGRLCVAEFQNVIDLERKVKGKRLAVHAHFADQDLDALPTAGLDAICVTLSKKPVARWEEALDPHGSPLLGSDVIALYLGDAKLLENMDETRWDRLQGIVDDHCVVDGVSTDGDEILCLYVGEVATEHRIYWGLDAKGAPARLMARFPHPSD